MQKKDVGCVLVAGRPSKATHKPNWLVVLGRRGNGAISTAVLSKTNLRCELCSHSHTHSHTPIEAHHAQCSKQGQKSGQRRPANWPTNNRGRQAMPVASMTTKGAQVGAQESGRESVSPWSASMRWTAIAWFPLHGAWRPRSRFSLSLSVALSIGCSCAHSVVWQEQIQIYCEAVVVPKRRVAVSGA